MRETLRAALLVADHLDHVDEPVDERRVIEDRAPVRLAVLHDPLRRGALLVGRHEVDRAHLAEVDAERGEVLLDGRLLGRGEREQLLVGEAQRIGARPHGVHRVGTGVGVMVRAAEMRMRVPCRAGRIGRAEIRRAKIGPTEIGPTEIGTAGIGRPNGHDRVDGMSHRLPHGVDHGGVEQMKARKVHGVG